MVSIKISGGEKFKAAVEEIIKKSGGGNPVLRVGFLEGATNRKGASIPMYAAINEFGAPSRGQPPRPFFRRMIKANKQNWGPELAGCLKVANYDVQKALALEGKEIEGQLVDSINKLKSPPLKKSTIKRKGFSKPLIETGDMWKSVASEIKK